MMLPRVPYVRFPPAAFYLLLGVIALWPVFAVPVPGLGDYLNHLARIHVITTLHHSPALQQFYELRWGFAPYLGMDAVLSLLVQVMPIYQAGRVFVALCVLMPVIAAVALRAAAQRRVGLLPAATFLLCYNYMLSWGFLNYLFCAGLALLLFAGWIATTHWSRWPRAALFAAGLLLVYLGHVFACAVYCIAVAAFEIAAALRVRFRPPRRMALTWLAAASQIVPALCLAVFFNLKEAVPGPSTSFYGDLGAKLRALLSPVLFPGDGASSAAAICVALLVGLYLWRHGHFRLDQNLWPAAAAMAAVGAVVPYVLFSTWGTDLRLPIIAVVLFIAGLSHAAPLSRAGRAVLLAALVCLCIAKSIQTESIFQKVNGQVNDIRQLVAALPLGARLLVIELDDPDAPLRVAHFTTTIHIPMVAVIDRDAFEPSLFTGLTLVHTRAAMTMSSSPGAPPIGLSALRDGLTHKDQADAPAFFNFGARIYWYDWPDKFDDVLIMHFGDPTPGLPPMLHRIATSPIADLYRIGHP